MTFHLSLLGSFIYRLGGENHADIPAKVRYRTMGTRKDLREVCTTTVVSLLRLKPYQFFLVIAQFFVVPYSHKSQCVTKKNGRMSDVTRHPKSGGFITKSGWYVTQKLMTSPLGYMYTHGSPQLLNLFQRGFQGILIKFDGRSVDSPGPGPRGWS